MRTVINPIIPIEDRLRGLEQILIDCAASNRWGCDGRIDAQERHDYELLRRDLLGNAIIASVLPRFVVDCRDLVQFDTYIKRNISRYAERRQYIWDAFAPAFAALQGRGASPADLPIADVLRNFDPVSVHGIWQSALRRRESDPEGAITSARTLLESVCKHILDANNVAYDDAVDLPKLYQLTARELRLAPDQHTERIFKLVLGGCKSVVNGLGAIRNKLGDAHGKGPRAGRPAARHAELAVNLAGSMATFLVQTWEVRSHRLSR